MHFKYNTTITITVTVKLTATPKRKARRHLFTRASISSPSCSKRTCNRTVSDTRQNKKYSSKAKSTFTVMNNAQQVVYAEFSSITIKAIPIPASCETTPSETPHVNQNQEFDAITSIFGLEGSAESPIRGTPISTRSVLVIIACRYP